MQLKLNDYRVLPVREKARLFLNMSKKNQVLTDISGVNNSKIAHLKKYPESINNLQLRNIEKIEDAFVRCVKAGKISLESCHKVLGKYSISKDKYIDKIITSIVNYTLGNNELVLQDRKTFENKFKDDIKRNLTLTAKEYTITTNNNTLSELYNYRCDFKMYVREYPTSKSKVMIRVDLILTKIPKVLHYKS